MSATEPADPLASMSPHRTYTVPRSSRGSHWDKLPGAKAEVDAVSECFKQAFPHAMVLPFTGAAATKAVFERQAGSCRYLHLATHGYFADPSIRSALATDSPGTFLHQQSQNVTGWDPGLLSGMVLAGVNRTEGPEQGILTALEVQELELGKVDLAVLSACETGLGTSAGGEGLLGLQRAFQVAGAHSVVASLWQVDDRWTRALMVRFYENLWEKKMAKLDALREAQLWVLAQGSALQQNGERGVKRLLDEQSADASGRLPPYYWAAFVLSGDWR